MLTLVKVVGLRAPILCWLKGYPCKRMPEAKHVVQNYYNYRRDHRPLPKYPYWGHGEFLPANVTTSRYMVRLT